MERVKTSLQDYEPKSLLQRELVKRCQANSKYSLRAFAKYLEMSPTSLSFILSGARPLARKRFVEIADKLNLDPKERELFFKHKTGDLKSTTEKSDYQTLTMDVFSVISDWHHYAILSLLEIPCEKLEAKWVSSRLGISVIEAKDAIERLKRLELIEKTKDGWKQKGPSITINNTYTTTTAKRFNKQLLEKAMESL